MARLDHESWLLVADGARALLFRNEGTASEPQLKVVRAYEQDNAPSRDQGTDKPGRTNSSVGFHRSSMEVPDWHRIAEDKFMIRIAADLAGDVAAKRTRKLVLALPPVALGVLRKALSAQTAAVVTAELDKDYTNLSVPELERTIVTALDRA